MSKMKSIQEEMAKIPNFVLTEDQAALDFAERHVNDLRFDHHAGKWFRWTDSHWRKDETLFAFSETRDHVRELSRGQKQRVIASASKIGFAGAVERGARADQRLAATQATWDRDPLLLGTPDGTVDLRTGVLRKAEPLDYISKITAVAPAATADCPTWDRFLREATSGDDKLIRFLQVVCGYAMTGVTSEHLLAFVYGPGGNGKSVFSSTIGGLLADYHTTADMETFTESKHGRHSTDLAMLRGARLVTCTETSEGRAWDETRIKQATGEDKITARFMRHDNFTYQPVFQLLIVGNHKPTLRNITEAMKRRLAIIPFVFAPKKPDRRLSAKLRAEWPGILRWMIDGCLTWQAQEGIERPEIVVDATQDYLNEQDLLGQWVQERLEKTSLLTDRILSTALYESFVSYAEKAGERRINDTKWFREQMEHHGFVKGKSDGQQVYRALRWRSKQQGGSEI